MRTLSILILSILLSNASSFAQKNITGYYISDEQRFEDESNPSKNTHRFQRLKIEIDISDITNMGFIKVNFPEDNLSMKWDITEKIDKEYNEEQKALYTSYNAYMNIENYRTDTQFTIVFINDYSSTPNTLHVVVQSMKGTRTWYHNLKRIN